MVSNGPHSCPPIKVLLSKPDLISMDTVRMKGGRRKKEEWQEEEEEEKKEEI